MTQTLEVDPVCACGHWRSQHVGTSTLFLDACIACACPGEVAPPTDPTVPYPCAAAVISGRWSINLPLHRAYRPDWPTWERERLAAMADVIGPGSVVYDIGAEEGDFSLLYASWGADVVLVEPNPKVWPCIRRTWDANPLVPPPAAWFVGFCGAVEGPVPPALDYDDSPVAGWPACAYGPVIPGHGFRHLAQQADATRTITVDALRGRTRRPTVLTVDVEGAEGEVLTGAIDTLVDDRPVVFVSIHPDFMRDLYATDPAALLRFMEALGYRGTLLAVDHEEHWRFDP